MIFCAGLFLQSWNTTDALAIYGHNMFLSRFLRHPRPLAQGTQSLNPKPTVQFRDDNQGAEQDTGYHRIPLSRMILAAKLNWGLKKIDVSNLKTENHPRKGDKIWGRFNTQKSNSAGSQGIEFLTPNMINSIENPYFLYQPGDWQKNCRCKWAELKGA